MPEDRFVEDITRKYVWFVDYEIKAVFFAKNETDAMRKVIAQRMIDSGYPQPLTQEQINECIQWYHINDGLFEIPIGTFEMPEPYMGPIDDDIWEGGVKEDENA